MNIKVPQRVVMAPATQKSIVMPTLWVSCINVDGVEKIPLPKCRQLIFNMSDCGQTYHAIGNDANHGWPTK